MASDLDRGARGRLRTLGRENADRVARHLVMAGRLLEDDPQAAYEHAQAAVRHAGRVDVVREAAGIAAYRTGRYAEALRELRTVRRLNGSSEHLPVMADCERGLGRPERALALGRDEGVRALDLAGRVELAIVLAGARLDLGEPEGALVALDDPAIARASGELAERIAQVRADVLDAAGRPADARAHRDGLRADGEGGEDDEAYLDDQADVGDEADVHDDEAEPDEDGRPDER